MGRFTLLEPADLDALLARFGVSPSAIVAPVDAGSVNTYYRVEDGSRAYYLRVDERADPQAVARELAVLGRVQGLAAPRVVATLDGAMSARHGEKPVLLFEALAGASVPWSALEAGHLEALGAAVAVMHRASAAGIAPHRFHPQALYEAHYLPMREVILRERPDAGEALDEVFRDGWRPYDLPDLPRAIVHADLFWDNLHFDADGACGLLDFEAAGEGPRLLDLAIALHALCFDPIARAFIASRVGALLGAYRARTAITEAEREAWPALLAFAAARFILTRVRDFDLGPGAEAQPVKKDYREFIASLRASSTLPAP